VPLAKAGLANKTFTIVVAERLFPLIIRGKLFFVDIRRLCFLIVIVGYGGREHVTRSERAQRPSLVLLGDGRNIHRALRIVR